MAFRFCDSFDHYTTAQLGLKWTQQFNASVQSSIVRTGPNALFLNTGLANVGAVSKTLDYQTKWTVGFAIYIPASSSGLVGSGRVYSLDSCGIVLMYLQIETDLTISFISGDGTTNYGNTGSLTPSFSLHINTWYYIEVQNTLSSSGTPPQIVVNSVLRVNGILLMNKTGNSGILVTNVLIQQPQANQHVFSGFLGNSNGVYFDDIYIADASGTLGNVSFLGDVSINCLYPRADNTPLQFSLFPTSPTTHYTHVNSNTPPGDTSYIYDHLVNDQDDFLWQPVSSFTGTIPAVHYLLYARKDDEGTRTIQHTIGNATYSAGNGGALGTPQFSLSDTYVYYAIPLDANPVHANAVWTVTNFNSQDFGVQISA